VHILWRAAVGCGESLRSEEKLSLVRFPDKERTRSGTFVSFSNLYTQHLASGVKTGNWHVFPIDNPAAWARMAIAGARALSFPPRLMRGNRNASFRREHE
jgi:hypothetical protein